MKKILVAGDAMLDQYIFGATHRISPEAPVPVFLESGKKKSSAGGAANVAVNIAAIGVEADIFCTIGDDPAGSQLQDIIKENNIGIKHVYTCQGRKTTCKLRYIAQNNQQIMRADVEDNWEIEFGQIQDLYSDIEKTIDSYGLVLLSDYGKGFLSEELTQRIIVLCNRKNVPVFVDVKGKSVTKYKGATLIKPNRKELYDLSGMSVDSKTDVEKAAQSLCRQAEADYVLTTLGAEGMLLTDKRQVLKEVHSIAREVYDVTGAGDTTIAYLSASVLQGKSLEEAMEIANVAAGIQVGRVGTSIVKPEEVQKVLRETVKHTKKVFTNGCFDILHAGHVAYLKEAKALGDWLIVGLNSDASVRRLKGDSRPLNTLEDRKTVLESLSFVDEVIPFDEDTPLSLIKRIHPDVLVKGGDYDISNIVGADEVLSYGGEVKVLSYVPGKSTTEIIRRMDGLGRRND